MREWIVCADKPTRAMERMRTGEIVRCRDCAYAQNGGTRCLYWSHKDSAQSKVAMPYIDPRGFCAWGKVRDA